MAPRVKTEFAGIAFSGFDKMGAGIGVPKAAFEKIIRTDHVELTTHFGDQLSASGIQKLLDQKVTGPILLKDDKIVFKPTTMQEVFEVTLKAP